MKLFGYDVQIKKAKPLPSTSGLLARYSHRMLAGSLVLYDHQTGALVEKGYRSNPDLYAVVNYIVRKARRANFFLYEIKDQKAHDDYRLLKGEGATGASLQQADLIKKKALVEVTNPQIDALLVRPNPEQDFRTFMEMAIGYKLLSGESFLHVVEGLGPVSRLYAMPPAVMDVKPGPTYLSIAGYRHRPTQTDLTAEEVIYSRTFSPVWNEETDEMRGLSPLRVLALSLQKSNEGRLAATKQYQNAGPPGILSFDDSDLDGGGLTTEQARAIEDDIYRKQASASGKGRMYVTNMKADWTALGLSPTDLNILESGVFDLRDFCRVYGIDSKVLGDHAASTFNNMAEARKAAIVDAVIPALLSLQDDLNVAVERFNTKGKRYCLDVDVSHYPELAEDLGTLSARLASLPLTPNQVLEAMQYEPYKHPMMDVPWFASGRQPITDFENTPPTDETDPKNDGTYSE